MTALAPAVESFFTSYLIAQRGASPHTIASYRDTFRLLFAWIREQSGTRPSDLGFADVDAATVSGFLAMLEDERHNTSRTRSQRLAAIHSLFRHAFAVSTLTDAHRQGLDVDARIAVLATHLGHVSPAHTYWYLTVAPGLADAVSERVALYYQGGNFR